MIPLPGWGEFRRRRGARGAVRLLLFLALVSLTWLRRDRLLSFLAGGRLDEGIAVILLAVLLVVLPGLESGGGGATVARSQVLRRFARSRLASAGALAMGFLYLAALLTPLLAPCSPSEQNLETGVYLKPSADHLLGTDKFGRDMLSRVLYGSRISLTIGFVAVAISITIGTLVGILGGYFRGIVDRLLMRFVDVLLSFPRLFLLLALIALFTPSLFLLIAVLGMTGWMGTARIVRGEVLSLREREFIQAARALGFGAPRIIFGHILPKLMAPVVVAGTLNIGNTIMLEASLSFLGLGVQPPTATWGSMINGGKAALTHAWWIATFPGLAILLTVICFNLVGDGLRDALDPRLKS